MSALKAVNCIKLNLKPSIKSDLISNEKSFVLYTAADGSVKIQAVLNNETIWLTQKAIAELFGLQLLSIY